MTQPVGDDPDWQAPPEPRIRAMFDQIVDRYDLVNDVLSFGMDRWWRHRVVRAIGARLADRVLDVGMGTGLLGRSINRRAGATVFGVDVSHAMLVKAARLSPEVRAVEGSVFHLPFGDAVFDAVVSAFVLRNLDDLGASFRELARVTVAGGRVGLVDLMEPRGPVLRHAFDAYFRTAAPAVGRLVGRPDAYRYLTRSLAQLPRPDRVERMLEEAGFERTRSAALTGGMAVLFVARRTR